LSSQHTSRKDEDMGKYMKHRIFQELNTIIN